MRRPLCLIALVLAAAVRLFIALRPPDFPSYSDLDGYPVALTGTVISKEFRTDTKGETYLQITLGHIRDVTGMARRRSGDWNVLCSAADDPEWADRAAPVGSSIRVEGTFYSFPESTNPGEFDSRLYYRILNCEFRLLDIHILAASASADPLAEHLYYVKRYLASVLDLCFHEKEAAILKAMLLGEKGMIDPETKDLYQGSGIIHILSISGLHVSLLAMGLYRFFRKIRLPRLPASILSVTALFLYAKMTGMSASSFRASVMFFMFMTAGVIRRTYDLLTGAAVAGILLILRQPLYLLHSGFLFSFGAVISIGLLAPCFSKKMSFLAVPLGSLPVYLRFYYSFPLYSLVLNLIVIPLMTFVMISGLLAMALGAAGGGVLAAARLAGEPASLILKFYEFLCRCASRLPGSSLVLGCPAAWQIFVYLGMLALFVYVHDTKYPLPFIRIPRMRRGPYVHVDPQKDEERGRALLGCLWIGLAVVILCLRFRSGLYLDFLDVGQGDGIYMECGGTRIFVDGGSTTKSDVGKYQIEPFLKYEGVSKLDLLILTHDDEDHCSGMKKLLEDARGGSGIRIGRLILPDIPPSLKGKNYRELERAARKGNIPVSYISRGDRIRAGRLYLTCLGPESGKTYSGANASSTVLFAEYGSFSCLLTGDLEQDGEEDVLRYIKSDRMLAQKMQKLTLLKIAHHGSRYATTQAFLESVSARYAVISCGRRNSYGHPAAETVQRIRADGMKILDTRFKGCVMVRSDGRAIQIRSGKGR